MDRLSIDFDQLISLIYLKGKQRGEQQSDQGPVWGSCAATGEQLPQTGLKKAAVQGS